MARYVLFLGRKVAAAAGGVLAATEAQDTAAFEGLPTSSGVLTASETQDAAAFAGTVTQVSEGTFVAAEEQDTAAFAGNLLLSGAFAITEAQDVGAFAGTYAVAGTLAAIEAQDRAILISTVPAQPGVGRRSRRHSPASGRRQSGMTWLGHQAEAERLRPKPKPPSPVVAIQPALPTVEPLSVIPHNDNDEDEVAMLLAAAL